jgi:tetratricopeptide (TPR) repeat protein
MTSAGRGVRSVAGLLLAILCLALPAAATPKAFGQADTAWHTGELDKAMKLYEDALGEGGLEPNEVVIAHSRIGTVKAALKDNNGALSAFRVAAAIDPEFELPADSGPIAKKLYAKAHKEAEAFGGQRLAITVTAPDTIPAQRAFTVQTEIPEGFAVLVAQVVVTIEDPITGKRWRRKQASEPKVTFEFPKRVAMRGARLKVRAAAEDSQNNAWTVSETKIKVEGTRELSALSGEPLGDKPKKDKKGDESFFDGPIPWIVGGALVVGGIILYAATRPPSDVTVGAPAWQ